jgi:hypothetical protein
MSRALGIVARLVWEGDFGGSVFCELIKVFPLFVERIDGLLGDIGVFHLVESQSTRPFVVGQFGVRLFPLVVKNPAWCCETAFSLVVPISRIVGGEEQPARSKGARRR